MDATNTHVCANGCGFYGTPETNNLCSKCYKHYLNELLAKELARLDISKNSTDSISSSTTSPLISYDSKNTTAIHDSGNVSSTKKNRCQCCKKRVGLIGFGCNGCGGLFCGFHRYPEEHTCKFDFKIKGRVDLANQNPLCKGDKLQARI